MLWLAVAEEVEAEEVGCQEEGVRDHQGGHDVAAAGHHQDAIFFTLIVDRLQEEEGQRR